MRKREIACYKQFLVFSQCFSQLYIFSAALCGNGLNFYTTTFVSEKLRKEVLGFTWHSQD